VQAFPNPSLFSPRISKESFGGFVGFQEATGLRTTIGIHELTPQPLNAQMFSRRFSQKKAESAKFPAFSAARYQGILPRTEP
jgi:hypothetical protein